MLKQFLALETIEALLSKGVSISAGLAKNDENKIVIRFKITTWEQRCTDCFPDNKKKEHLDGA